MSDVFRIGDVSWNQTFIAANESSWGWIPADGFLGMGFSYIAEPSTQTVVETMMQDDLLDQPRFAIYYGKDFPATGNDSAGQGVMTLGGSEEDKYVDGDVVWLPVRKDNVDNGTMAYQLWRSTLRQISGHRSADPATGEPPYNGSVNFAPGKANAVFDTGAGTISLPTEALRPIYRSIGWDYDAVLTGSVIPLCSDFNDTWSVTFTFSGMNDDGIEEFTNVTVRGDQLAEGPFAGRNDACIPPFDSSFSEGLALIGQQFIRRFYSIYDYGSRTVEEFKPRIGFGQLKAEWQPPFPLVSSSPN